MEAPTTIFTLDEALDKIITLVTAFARDRAIILNSLNAFEKVFVDFVASQQNYNTSVSGQISGLDARIDSLNTRLGDRMDRLETGVDDLNAAVTAQLARTAATVDAFGAKVEDLASLVQDMLQGLQGVATSALQQQEIDLLNEILADVTPDKRPASIGLDLTHVTTEPQPKPSKPGP